MFATTGTALSAVLLFGVFTATKPIKPVTTTWDRCEELGGYVATMPHYLDDTRLMFVCRFEGSKWAYPLTE